MNIYMAPLIALIITLVLMPVAIPILRRLKFGQSIREIGPSWHRKKTGTPTMGGVVIFVAVLVALLIFSKEIDHTAWFALFCALGFGIIGFIDDFIKVILKRNLGLRAWEKTALQLLVGVIFVFGGLNTGVLSTSVLIPFTGAIIDFSWVYIPFALFVLVGAVNSVNLTDGIDGLATSVTIVVMLYFGFAAQEITSPLVVFCFTVVGSLLGFLIFNKYPARVFMGDTGSLFLGGAVAAVALLQQNPFILLIVGLVYILETLSVIIQVTSFKITGKRIFKMSPLHHHFEMSGWSEVKIVSVFTAVTIITAVISYLCNTNTFGAR